MALSIEDVNGDEDAVIAATDRVPVVALTRAERGATIWLTANVTRCPRSTANVVDPTGAGDVFATAFFMALEAGEASLAAARAPVRRQAVSWKDWALQPSVLADVEERLDADT